MTQVSYQFVTNGDMSADITSNAQQLSVQNYGLYSIQANYATTGTLGGTFTLQASLDRQVDFLGNVLKAGTWVDIGNSTLTIAAAGSSTWDISDAAYPFVRLVYTAAGGDTGVLNAFLFERAQ